LSGLSLWSVSINGTSQPPNLPLLITRTVTAPLTIVASCGNVTAAYGANSLGVIDIVLSSTANSATATNIRVTNITNITPSNIARTGGFPLGQAWGNLAGGQSAARNFFFGATSGSLSIPFTFTVTYEADNMPSRQTVISVPFPRP
jgi:hypothetical protein